VYVKGGVERITVSDKLKTIKTIRRGKALRKTGSGKETRNCAEKTKIYRKSNDSTKRGTPKLSREAWCERKNIGGAS